MTGGRAPALLAALAFSLSGAPRLARADGYRAVAPPSPTPWDNPRVLGDPAARRRYEFTPMFNHHRERPPWALRVFASRPEAKAHPEALPPTLLLGDLLFNSPALLGRRAAFFGLSCASCHPNGAASTDLDVGPQTDRPGNVDMLSGYFTPRADDGIFAPRNVPSLRGARYTAPYGHAGAVGSLSGFVDHVASTELDEPPMRRDWNAALVMYLEQLDFLPNAQLDPLGRLTAKAPEAAHRGEAVFDAARPQLGGMSCASCHVPSAFFTDRRSHLFHHGRDTAGAMEGFDTPTLLDTAETAPYFYDGSAATLRDAVDQLDARHQLGLKPSEKSDLTAYLAAVGAVDQGDAVPSAQEQVSRPAAHLALLLDGPYRDDAQLWPLALDTARHELRAAVLAGVRGIEPEVGALEQFASAPAHRAPSAANRAALARLRNRLLEAAGLTRSPRQVATP